MTTPAATIAVVPREVFSTTQRTIETIYQRTEGPFELVCIDGGSPPEVQAYLESTARRLGFTLVRTDCYLTPNQARNLAVQHVRTPYVAFVDNDVVVGRNWLQPLVNCADETGAWVVGPLYFEHAPEQHRLHMVGGTCRIQAEPDGRRYYYERHVHPHDLLNAVDEPIVRHETELIEFHAVLVAMEAFSELGPLDESLFCQAEHGDLCLSVRAAGRQVFVEPESRITYIPPKRLQPNDSEYFFLRWSEAWTDASLANLAAKWRLTPEHEECNASRAWIRQHRRHGYPALSRLRKILGRKLAASLQKRLFNRFEAAANRRRYAPEQFGQLSRPDARVVYQPRSTSAVAA